MSITIRDIAKEAGVSATSVSFFLNGKAQHFSNETCSKIKEVIRKYDFTPSYQAKAIKSGRTYLIGVVISDITQSFWMDIISGIEEIIEANQYHMLLVVLHGNLKREEEVLAFLNRKGVDGFIYAPVTAPDGNFNKCSIQELAKRKPLVCITANIEGVSSVYNDEVSGGEQVAEYFMHKGHRKIAYIGQLKPFVRGAVFINHLKKYGINAEHFNKVDELMHCIRNYTAIFCFCDSIALELCDKAMEHGLNVPDDLSVIGYDNMNYSQHFCPKITTVDQSKNEIGVKAAEILMNMLEGKCKLPVTMPMNPKLIERESVKLIKQEK